MPRKHAYHVLLQVMQQGQFANLQLRKIHDLKEKDMDLCTQLVYGTLRQMSYWKAQWSDLVTKKVSLQDEIILNMSCFQLFKMTRLPDYAIVHSAVELSKNKGFINAVLRNVIRRGEIQVDPEHEVEIKAGIPTWIYSMWKAHYGQETAEKIAMSMMEEATLFARINTLKTNQSDFEQEFGAKFVSPIGFIDTVGLLRHPAFEEGLFVYQDLHSQQVVEQLELKEDLRVLDTCAAPGTKTAQIAMQMNNTGKIVTVELHEHRSQLIEQLMEKCGVHNVECVVQDVREFEAEQQFDRILCDVPCSGLGVLKGKPEIKYNVTPQTLDEIVALQKEILEHCAALCKSEGILVYSTCTLNKKENEKQIEAFLKRHLEFILLQEKTLFPFDDHADGFYWAKLCKTTDLI